MVDVTSKKYPTYKDLLHLLQHATLEQLDQNITIYDMTLDEYVKAEYLDVTVVSDVMDDNHIVIKTS